MAQLIKLKRTAVPGRKPTTSNIELGELAINTYDGKIFFEKDSGTPEVVEIATEDTYHFYTTSLDSRYVNLTGDETIEGNKTFSNNITIVGNLSVEGTTTTIDSTTVNIGDNILELNYGGSATTSGILTKDATGGSTTSGSLLWDSTNDYWKLGKLGSESEVITISNLITNLPSGTVSGSSQITITDSQISDLDHYTDTDVKTKLDTELVLSGSNIDGITVSGSFSGSFQGDGTNLTGLTVDQVATVSDTFTNVSSKVVTHNFATKNVIVTVYDENDGYFIPNSIVTTNDNQVTVTFASTESGRVVVAKGGHVVSGSANDANQLNGEAGSYYLDYDNFTNIPSGIVSSSAQISNYGVFAELNGDGLISGSSQITDLTTHKETVSGASSYAVTHNLNEQYPIVQAWNTGTSQQELPTSVTTNSVNQVTVVFSTTFAGVIIVKK